MTTFNDWSAAADDRLPIYLQIIDRFKRGVIKGEMEGGSRIPSIRDLALAIKVNPNTVQRAYQEMEREGIIYSQRGMGYFVTEDETKVVCMKQDLAKASIERFFEEMRALGLSDAQILETVKQGLQAAEEDRDGK